MGKVSEAYEAKYGIEASAILRMFGGNPDAIVADQEARLGQPDELTACLGTSPATAEDLAECAYWQIIRALKAAFFGRMPREQVLAIVRALKAFPDASITLCKELTYNEHTFLYEWNDHHPNEPRLELIDAN